MSADPSNPSEKPSSQPKPLAAVLFGLRLFWVTDLTLILIVAYGLYAGWQKPVQWSNAFFYGAAAQICIAAISLAGMSGDLQAASTLRYLARGDVAETRQQLAQLSMSKEGFALRAFAGGLMFLLFAALVTWL